MAGWLVWQTAAILSVVMSPVSTYLGSLKDFILVFTILYFYGLAFSMSFGKNLFGLDQPFVFLLMCSLFLLAVGYEIFFSWWKSNIMIVWAALWIMSYGIIGLYLAPAIFGSWIVTYILFEPLIIVFMGGFAFSYGHILAQHFTAHQTLGKNEIAAALELLPGWQVERNRLVKTFEFIDFSQALNFVNQIGRIAENMRHYPNLMVSGRHVRVSVLSRGLHGLTKADVEQARKIDAV